MGCKHLRLQPEETLSEVRDASVCAYSPSEVSYVKFLPHSFNHIILIHASIQNKNEPRSEEFDGLIVSGFPLPHSPGRTSGMKQYGIPVQVI